MIDQGSSELNIIIGVSNDDFDKAIKAIYDIFCCYTAVISYGEIIRWNRN